MTNLVCGLVGVAGSNNYNIVKATMKHLCICSVLLTVLCLQTAVSQFPPPPQGDPIKAIQGLVGRILGEEWVDKFSYEVITQSSNGMDMFEVGTDTKVNRPVFRGNNGVALALAFNYYLKYYCNCSISWGRNGTGDQLNLPSPLPLPSKDVTVEVPNRYRYYQNVCTVSYSMAWWDWERWEREIDWMAMNGLNLILSFTGQELVWKTFYSSLGLTEDELDNYFSGPAFLAWQRMGNIHGWGGPLDDGWISEQAILQKKIVAQIRMFGMINVLPGFAGHVPEGLKRVYPNANYTRSAEWGRFGTQYSEDYLLEPTDPLFMELGKKYYDFLISQYGTDHVYNADTYNEMRPSSTDLTFLKESNAAIYNTMKSSDPDAVYLMQGWLFRESGFWTSDRIKAYLSGVPDDRMIILDLSCDREPIWSRTESFFGKPFIWCILHNNGGIRAIYGNMTIIGNDPVDARLATGSTMVGVGMAPEAIEQNPVIYDLMGEMSWRRDKVEAIMPWVEAYAQRRYGAMTENVHNAWSLLLTGAYQIPWSQIIKSLVVRHPEFGLSPDMHFAPYKIATAWKYLVTDAMSGKLDSKVGPLRYDIVDIGRQMIVNMFADVYKIYTSGYTAYMSSKNKDVYTAMKSLADAWVTMFTDLDKLLGSDPNFLLGTWIDEARKSAAPKSSTSVVNNLEFNARNQISMWGPNENIEDYAAKEWSGVVSDYYAPRWKLFLQEIDQSVMANQTFNKTAYESMLFTLESGWGKEIKPYPTTPTGDTLEISGKLLQKYFRDSDYIAKTYEQKEGFDIPNNDLYGGAVDLWTNATEQYIVLCEMNPSCVGFSCGSDLKKVSFKSSTAGAASTAGRVLYIRKS